MTLEDLYQEVCLELEALQKLYSINIDHKLEAKELILESLNISLADFVVSKNKIFNDSKIKLIKKNTKERKSGKPLSYIINKKYFYESEFYIDERVLIPRSETELLVDYIVKDGKLKKSLNKSLLFYDLGSGSGCIGLSLLKQFKKSFLICIDISKEAIEVCKINANKLEVFDRCIFINKSVEEVSLKEIKDYLKQLKFKNYDDCIADYILANPPYISRNDRCLDMNVKKFEPSLSLFADDNGMRYIKGWFKWSEKLMNEHTLLMYEFGMSQTSDILNFLKTENAGDQKILKDLSGKDRFLIYKKRN